MTGMARRISAPRPFPCMLALMLALTAFGFVPATTALAATGDLYLGSSADPGMTRATDPHGNVWLPGTTDGTTTGPLDPGTNPASPGYGHLWTADVPSGFCRIIPANPATGKAAFLDRNTPGGCITAGQKPGQMALDPRRNADGTLYVYTPDWAVRSAGVYRLTYDPGKQIMTRAEVLAPNRYPTGNTPFDVQLGPKDHKLYVSDDKDGNIGRISGVNGPIAEQTVETIVTQSTDGRRVRAITFACWSNLATLNGGHGAARAPGAPGCTAQDPAPDLVLSQKSAITVVLNAETCQTAPGGCVALTTTVKALAPMGLRTDPKDPTVIYISDSPGAVSQILRYRISTDIQDSYASYGTLDDGSIAQFSFAFSVGFGPDHAMYVGDDPSAGATAFNGRYFRIAPNAPADTYGTPGDAAIPAAPPSLATGALLGGGVSLPSDGVWMGTHLWMADAVNGLCRMDAPVGGGLSAMNAGTCMVGANAANLTVPEQSAFDAAKNLLYVADGGSKSIGVVRFTFDPATETLGNPQVIASGMVGSGVGLDNQLADAVALDPLADALYVGFRQRNVGANTGGTQLARVPHASAADTRTQTVEFFANTTRDVPVFGLGIVVNPATSGAPATADLYIGDNKGVDVLYNVAACAPGACTSLLLINGTGPVGFATDGTDHLYLAGGAELIVVGVGEPIPPAPPATVTPVYRYTISTHQSLAYSSVGVSPDGTQQEYAFVHSLALDPSGNLYVADNPNSATPPNGVGHVWKVAPPGPGTVAQPAITSRPTNPTNDTNPSFAFSTLTSGATFKCSLVASGAADAFGACPSGQRFGPLTDGNYAFKVAAVDGTGAASTPAIYLFTVDTVPPVVTITQAPTSPTNNNLPSFIVSATKNGAPYTGMAYQCSLSAGADAFVSCGSPQWYGPQDDGDYTFKVRGTDLAGNVSAVQTASLRIDTTAPTVTASPAGGQYSDAQSVTLAPGTNEPATTTISYTTDGSSPLTSATKRTYTGPIAIAATTTLRYVALDAAGNQSVFGTQQYTLSPHPAPPGRLPASAPGGSSPQPSGTPAPAPAPRPPAAGTAAAGGTAAATGTVSVGVAPAPPSR